MSSLGPGFKAKRLRGSRAKGKAYERAFGKALNLALRAGTEPCVNALRSQRAFPVSVHLGQWISFLDSAGPGWAQPDAFVLESSRILLFELKLTQRSKAWAQLKDLYAPLLEKLYGLPCVCIQVCKNLRYEDPRIITGWNEIKPDCTWHWWPEDKIK